MSTPLADAIQSFAPALPLAVAYSGGADSTALLLACAQKWPGQVGAIHVHHGLQAAADDFVAHCEAFCAAHNIVLEVRRIDARHAPGQSPEDAARDGRYAVLDAAVRESRLPLPYRSVALAQHADDQVETLLLALSRGAGLPGLAGMPVQWERNGIPYYRPLLGVRADAIRTWLAERGVAAIEDPSNANEAFTRNRIRARLLPVLDAAFPGFRETFARSARHAAQAQQVLDEVAQADMAAAVQTSTADGLRIDRVRAMSPPRQANLLRHWFKTKHGVVPNTAQLNELLAQLADCSTRGHQIRIKVADGFAVREGPVLAWYNRRPGPNAGG